MKANEFVKKHGVGRAKVLLVESIGCGLYVDANYRITLYLSNEPHKSDDIDFIIHRYELERLVESHEIVKKLGGLDGAKKKLNSLCIFRWITPEITALEQAIADVEACQ
ncbi:hypothetical protein [Acinetobacter rudis]|uniref:hypothetical protein n=1 Tax=Acinetobacter rudis TaxID=632955 RepID=UPI0033422969